jgi:gliding motility-associated lipoprotein GldH
MCCIAFCACNDNRVYEYNYLMKQNNWYIDTVPTFHFSIDQPEKRYNVFLNVRNTVAYPYYNLFVNYQLCDSVGNKLQGQQVEMMLLDPKTGRPLGNGIGDLFFHQFPVLSQYTFPYKGKYSVKLVQYMRENPLPEVMSAGVRIEEVAK